VERRDFLQLTGLSAGALLIPPHAPSWSGGAPIVYFEIAGPETQALKTFYATVFAWEIDANATIAASSTGGVRGGLRQDPPEKLLYLGVSNIDQTLQHIADAGGKTIVPRTVVPGVVTFAIFLDPAGNRMGLAEFGSYK
jgi:predicted enzyme related to lactoylglutathione lyase